MKAGAASIRLQPPLGLPMVGFVRQERGAAAYGRASLEVTAVVLESNSYRSAIIGIDAAAIGVDDYQALALRLKERLQISPEATIINCSHTHLAPPFSDCGGCVIGKPSSGNQRLIAATASDWRDEIIAACSLAVSRLEEARPSWSTIDVDIAVNRRERTHQAGVVSTILGWNPDELVDTQAVVLQMRRSDESPIVTVVGYGCHPVTTGHDLLAYSGDYPAFLRQHVRQLTGGECVFLQGAAGNVNPRFAFNPNEAEAARVGRNLAIAALHSLNTAEDAWERSIVVDDDGSVTPIKTYRSRLNEHQSRICLRSRQTPLALPLGAAPDLESVRAERLWATAEFDRAMAAGDIGAARVAWYHGGWAERIEAQILDGSVPVAAFGQINALRIGAGAIVSLPGEPFSEIGMAIKERSPASPTLVAGYSNGYLGYLPTAAEYRWGGYEAGSGYKTAGLPALPKPVSEDILTSAAVRSLESLFPGCDAWPNENGWAATGCVPSAPTQSYAHPRGSAW